MSTAEVGRERLDYGVNTLLPASGDLDKKKNHSGRESRSIAYPSPSALDVNSPGALNTRS